MLVDKKDYMDRERMIVMELSEIQQQQKEFIISRKWERFHATQVFSHLIEELGEVVKFFLYKEDYKIKGAGHAGYKENVSREFAQAFNLFLQLAIAADVNLEDAWLKEYDTNLKRFDAELWVKLAKEKSKSE